MITRVSNSDIVRLAEDVGSIAMATLSIATNPSTNDTVTIGSDVYEFGGSGGNINVTIGGDAAASRANLETAINESGTEDVVADDAGLLGATTVRIQAADAPGGTPVIGAGPNLSLSETLTAPNDMWNMSNLNSVGFPPYSKMSRGKITISAQMLLGTGTLYLEFPFTVGAFEWQAYDSNGTLKAVTATTLSFTTVVGWVLTAGGTPFVATDYIVFSVFGE